MFIILTMRKISVKTCLVIIVFSALFSNFAHPITPTLFKSLGFHDYMFGTAFAAMSFTNFLFSPFWGSIMRKLGTAKMMALCYLGYAIAQVGFGLADSEFMMIMVRLFSGIFIGGFNVGQIMYIMDNSDEAHRSKNLVYCATINTIMAAFGYMLGGILGDISIYYSIIAQVLGLVMVAIAIYVLLADRPKERRELEFSDIIKASNPFKAFINSKEFINNIILCFLLMCIFAQFATTAYDQAFNYFIKDQFGFPPSYNGVLKALVGFVSLFANMTICQYLLKKTNIFKSLIYVFGICVSMLIAIIVVQDVLIFILINIVFFAFNAVYQPLIQASMSSFEGVDNSVIVGLYNAVKSLGMVSGSLLAGFIYELGPRIPFVLSAISFLGAIILVSRLYKHFKRHTSPMV